MRKAGFFILLIFIISRPGYGQDIQSDSVRVEPCFKAGLNYVQFFEKEALLPFYKKWSGSDKIAIAVFGDSHVQPGIYPGEMRRQLQVVRGQAGFGMTFPYSTAKTYSAIDYFSSHTGNWIFSKSIEFKPKLPLGVSGVTAKTSDSLAGFKIKFKKSLSPDIRKMRIYCRQDKKSFDFRVRTGKEEFLVTVDSAHQNPIELIFQKVDSTIEVELVKGHASQTEFEFYGLSLENPAPGGVLLHSLGIGGSRFGSILEEKLFDSQLPTLQPDLVILDFGTNDILYDNRVPDYMESQVTSVIKKVRKAAPGVTILLTTTQDMTRKSINITAAEEFSDMIRRIAKTQHCPFYDWFWISGGPEKMMAWFENGLAQQDMIHLTMKGYTLKGQLISEALMKSLARISSPTPPDSIVFNVDSLKMLSHIKVDSLVGDSLITATKAVKEVNFVRHKIIKGETLRSIARLYHVKIDELKKTNGLQNSMIIEGNYLNVEIHEAERKKALAKPAKAKAGKQDKYVIHKVVEGDTMSELAEKYKVSVAQIKKLNGLRTSRIKTGHNLKIKLKSLPQAGR